MAPPFSGVHMAKKIRNELDEFGFSKDLDFSAFDFDSRPPKDNRSPVTKLATGFASGVKDTAKSPAFIRKLVLEALPKGYGDGFTMADNVADSLKGLYNEAAKEVKPVLKDLKRTTRRVTPSLGKVLPKAMADKISKWSKDEDESQDLSAQQQREASLAMQMGEIFKFQTQQAAERNAEVDTSDKIRQGIEAARHKDNFSQLDAIRVGVQQLASYQNKINAGYQRKSLELQFRHYFVAVDMLEEQRKSAAVAKSSFETIVHNTGLPDYAKITTAENVKQIMRNKFLEDMNDSIFAKRRDFIKRVGSRLGKQAMDKVRGFKDNVSMGLMAADTMLDQREMMADLPGGPDAWESGGGFAGGIAADSIGTRLGKGLRKRLTKNDKFAAGGVRVANAATNAPQYLTNWANKSSWEEEPKTGMGRFLKKLGDITGLSDSLKDAIRSENGIDTTLTADKAGNMQERDVFGRQTNKSITEIIPGYLARIFRELQVMRTGNDKIELTRYDFNTNKFSSASAVTSGIFKSIVGSYDASNTAEKTNALIDSIEKQTGKKLTAEQRKALGNHLISQNLKNFGATKDRLTDHSTYTGAAREHSGEFSEMFSSYFQKGSSESETSYQQRKGGLMSRAGELGVDITDARKKIQQYVNNGDRDSLEQMGILSPGSDRINMEKVQEYFYGGEFHPEAPIDPNTGAPRKMPRQMRRSAARSAPVLRVLEPQPQAASKPDIGGYDRNNQDLVDAIKDNSPKSINEVMSETLVRIEKRLEGGLLTHVVGTGPVDGKSGFGFNKSISSNLGAAGDSILSMVGGARRMGVRAMSRAGSAMGVGVDFAGNVLKGGLGFAGSVLGGLGGGLLGRNNDFFLPNMDKPALFDWKFKAGHYVDEATGAVLQSANDIKGNVVDKFSELPDKVVLRIEDVGKLYRKTNVGGKIASGIKAVLGVGRKLGKRGMERLSNVPGTLGTVAGLAGNLAKKAFGLLDLPQDIYVKGEMSVPILHAYVMRAGGYFTADGKPVLTPGAINGPISDSTGATVVTQEHLARGLVFNNGEPVRAGLQKIAHHLIGKLATGAKRIGKTLNFVKDAAISGLSTAKNFLLHGFKGMGGRGGSGVGETDVTVDLLTSIRDILDSRLPKSKKRVIGDIDGDGIREGSAADLMRKAKAKAEAAAGKAAAIGGNIWDRNKGIGSGLMGGLKGLYNKFTGKKSKGEEDDGSVLGDVADAASIAHDLSLWQKTKGLAKGAWKMGAAGVGGLMGLVGLGRGARLSKLKAMGPAGRAALRAQLEAAQPGIFSRLGGALKGAGGSVISRAGGLLGSAGTAIAGAGKSVLGKIGLGGAASAIASGAPGLGAKALKAVGGKWNIAAALGMGAYEAYGVANDSMNSDSQKTDKYKQIGTSMTGSLVGGALGAFLGPLGMIAGAAIGGWVGGKIGGWMTSASLDALSTVRYAQYGFLPTDKDHLQRVFDLEGHLSEAVTYSGGVAQLSNSKMQIKRVLDAFGLTVDDSDENQKMLAIFLNWFNRRFKPVFLVHLTALKAVDPKAELNKVSDLSPENKKKYLSVARMNGGPFDVRTSPFPELSALQAGPEEVKAALVVADAEIEKAVKKNATPANAGQAALAAAAATAEAGKQAAKDKSEKAEASQQQKSDAVAAKAESEAAKPDDSLWGKTKGYANATWDTMKNIGGFLGEATGITALAQKVGGMMSGTPVVHPGKGTGGDINSLAQPTGNRSWKAVKDTILGAAKMAGVDGKLMASIAAIESGFDYTVKAGTSSATGLYQFITDTWNSMLRKYGAKYGIAPNTPPTDPRANALMGAEFLKENMSAIQSAVKRPLTDTDVYLAHFLGAGGAKQFLSADPSSIGASVVGQKVAWANRNVFYDKSGAPRTVGEIYSIFSKKLADRGKQMGIETSGVIATAAPAAAGADNAVATSSGGTAAPAVPPAAAEAATTAATAVPSSPPSGMMRTSASPAGSDPAAQAMGMGFQTAKPADLNDQAKYQKQVSTEMMGTVSSTLAQSLQVQQAQLSVLQSILGAIGNSPVRMLGNNKPGNETAQSTAPEPKTSQPMQKAPVSMARQV